VFADGAETVTFEEHITNMTDMVTDAVFWYGNHRSAILVFNRRNALYYM
jgi:hypothetical protein